MPSITDKKKATLVNCSITGSCLDQELPRARTFSHFLSLDEVGWSIFVTFLSQEKNDWICQFFHSFTQAVRDTYCTGFGRTRLINHQPLLFTKFKQSKVLSHQIVCKKLLQFVDCGKIWCGSDFSPSRKALFHTKSTTRLS